MHAVEMQNDQKNFTGIVDVQPVAEYEVFRKPTYDRGIRWIEVEEPAPVFKVTYDDGGIHMIRLRLHDFSYIGQQYKFWLDQKNPDNAMQFIRRKLQERVDFYAFEILRPRGDLDRATQQLYAELYKQRERRAIADHHLEKCREQHRLAAIRGRETMEQHKIKMAELMAKLPPKMKNFEF
uniref:Uncharacterized protein n=1 Tax=Marseillevirus LCMAC103 TaxID=2506604 RepID=A0A481YUY7_9VIRU|nr:MAG: hypothetical protein LCMAC103_00400 [Marseillevirus LCMAC103]